MIVFLLQAIFATGLAYALSWIFGALTPTIAVVSLFVGYVMARRREKQLRVAFPDLKFLGFHEGAAGVLEVVLATVVLYASVRHFAWMFFRLDAKWMTLHPNNFGDLPLHINYIREMASGASFPPVNPSFASETLRYPFGADLYSALWEILGVPLSSHLFFVGLAASIVGITVLRWFGSWWAVGAFFFSGGLIGWSLLMGQHGSADLTQGVDWKNLFLSVFITQRGVLFALPVGLILIETTRRVMVNDSKNLKLSPGVQATLGLLWGLLPLFHVHAFVIVSLMMAGFALSAGGLAGFRRLLASRMAFVAYVPAIYFVLRSSDFLAKASVVHLDPWWTTTLEQAPQFLVLNFGPWLLLPFAILAALTASKRFSPTEKRSLLLELALYVGLFILFFNVMLAPWSWDNIKILIFPYLGFARLAWVVLDPILPDSVKFVTAFILFLSGFLAVNLSLAPPSVRGLAIYQTAQIGALEGALAEVPRGAVFAAAPTHDHPLTYFGRVRAVGYEGHLWSHGIAYKERSDKFDAFMRGRWVNQDPTDIARGLGITHIVWGTTENLFYQTEPFWPKSFKNVSRVPSLHVYEVPK